ncbi:Protein T05B9.2 [Aphelenchoides avenae]|nr:Protein T05B9.2 [Aphelenchus avenae]
MCRLEQEQAGCSHELDAIAVSQTHKKSSYSTSTCRTQQSAKQCLTPTNATTFIRLSVLYAFVALIPSVSTMPIAMQQRAGRCYAFAPGTTIPGAEYRRDYGLTRKECAEVCKHDACCMAFEWFDDECTLKSRSLNGTVETKPGAFFGLCLDYDDEERDRFWDHELGGTVTATKPEVARDECADYCKSQQGAIAFSWRTYDETDVDAKDGHCECIEVLHHVRLSFGSFAGFLV